MLRASLCCSSLLVLTAGLAVQLGCSSEQPREEGTPYAVASADSSGPETLAASSDVPVEALSSLEKVYVPLQASSMQSLDDALADKGYGNVKTSDFKPQFDTTATEFGPAITAYSSADWIAPSSLFQPMSLTQWLEAALSDDGSEGVIINPGHAGQTLALTRAEILQALEWLPRRDPLPMEIHLAR